MKYWQVGNQMIPSILSQQLRQGLVDFLTTTFPMIVCGVE